MMMVIPIHVVMQETRLKLQGAIAALGDHPLAKLLEDTDRLIQGLEYRVPRDNAPLATDVTKPPKEAP